MQTLCRPSTSMIVDGYKVIKNLNLAHFSMYMSCFAFILWKQSEQIIFISTFDLAMYTIYYLLYGLTRERQIQKRGMKNF